MSEAKKLFSFILIFTYLASQTEFVESKLMRDDLYTSIAVLKDVIRVEKYFVHNLKYFIARSQIKLQSLKSIFQIGNRIETFNSKRLLNEIIFLNGIGKNHYQIFRKLRLLYDSLIPNHSDLNGAILGLVRLQRIYGYTAEAIVNGSISKHVQLPEKLKASDCYLIGKQLNSLGIDNFATQWLEAALKLTTREASNRPPTLRAMNRTMILESFENVRNIVPEEADLKMGLYDVEKLQTGCRNEYKKPAAEASKLYCKYERNNHPFLRLAPIKVEILNFSPYLVVFHGVIYDSEIEVLKNLAYHALERAPTFDNKKGTNMQTNFRTGKYAWIRDEDDAIMQRLNQRMSDMTSLTMSTAENLQIANYGIGGHYSLHWDHYADKRVDIYGISRRIATILFYMSDVEVGGSTIWPYLNVSVNCVKGNAAFWYNLDDHLEGEYRTLHAACPVVIGSKWAANKWVHYEGELFTKPCSL